MANQLKHAAPKGNTQLLQHQRQLPKGSPKMAPQSSKSMKTAQTTSNGTRTGDVVSDSDDGDDEGDSSDDDDDDLDEPDVFALSAASRIANRAASRLAGLSPADAMMLDDEQAAAGAQHSDEDYGAIDDISDGNESVNDPSEKKVLRAAEQDLVAEFERQERPQTANGVTNEINGLSIDDIGLAHELDLPMDDSQQYDDMDFGLDMNEDPFRGLSSNDTLYQEMIGDAETELGAWRQADMDDQSLENSMVSNAGQKRVRFRETTPSRTSSMSSDEDPRDSYPDLFDGGDDPVLQHAMTMGMGSPDAMQDNESMYDFEDDYHENYERVNYGFEFGDSHSDSSDFSSDEDDGDTTDEEAPEVLEARVKARRAALAQEAASAPNSAPSTPAPSGPSTPSTLKRAKTTNGRLNTPKTNDGRPKMGTFVRDPTKARVEADIQGSGVKVTCPRNPPEKDREYWQRAREAMGSRDGSPKGEFVCVRPTPRSASIPKRAFTAKSTLGTMFNGNLDFLRSNDEWGIEELIMGSRHDSMRGSFTSTTMTDNSSADADNSVNMEDYLTLDDSEAGVEVPESASAMSPSSEYFDVEDLSTPQQDGSNAHLLGMLEHRNGLISSFRNNQDHARLVSSMAAHPEQRAQTSEANALQKGRRAAANTPMTPARKSRDSKDFTGSGIKKNASPLVQKHRRSRGNSLSNVAHALDQYNQIQKQ